MYKLLISIPVHERLEVAVDQVLNIKSCNNDCAIIIHISPLYSDMNSSLPKSVFLKIVEEIGDVIINPVSVRTGRNDIIQAHLENYKYAKSVIEFEYFCLLASNELFIKRGLEEFISKADAGTLETDTSGWVYEPELKSDDSLIKYSKKKNVEIKKTLPEGQFYKKEIFDFIYKEVVSFFDYKSINLFYPREEIYFPTILQLYKKERQKVIVSTPFTYSAYHFAHLWNVTRLRIVLDLSKKNTLFSAKRIDRNINDSVRCYLRKELGYFDKEEYLLKKYCALKKYTTFLVDYLDAKKIFISIISNYRVILNRIGF